MKISQWFITSALSIALTLTVNSTVLAEQMTINSSKQSEQTKHALMTKLASVDYFSANFKQSIKSVDGELIQTGAGNISIKKPSLVHWQTTEPDETLIISDGESLWFYDPFIEQVTAYSLNSAIKNTPILLLTNNDEALWQHYDVTSLTDNQGNMIKDGFLVKAKQEKSQVKHLTIIFKGNELTQFSFQDATGQTSEINLSDFNKAKEPANSLFSFTVPEGVRLEDKR